MKVKCERLGYKNTYMLVDDQDAPIDEVCRYLRFLDACGKSPNTTRSYAYHLKLYYDFLEYQQVSAKDVLTSEKQRPIDFFCSFMIWLQYPGTFKGIIRLEGESCLRTNQTVNAIMAAVLYYYQYLSANGEVGKLPVYVEHRTVYKYSSFLSELTEQKETQLRSIIKKPTYYKPVKSVTRDQYYMLLQLCTCRRDKILLAFLFEGGLRLSEALGTHLSDINELHAGIVKITPRENNENGARVKEYAGGLIKLPDYVIDLIVAYMDEDIPNFDSDYLFLTLHGKNRGKALKADTVEKLFASLSEKSGIDVHPHMLRHGFATEKLESGWDMIDIKAYLRHRSISSTQIYATYSDELKKEKMREFFSQNELSMRRIADDLKG